MRSSNIAKFIEYTRKTAIATRNVTYLKGACSSRWGGTKVMPLALIFNTNVRSEAYKGEYVYGVCVENRKHHWIPILWLDGRGHLGTLPRDLTDILRSAGRISASCTVPTFPSDVALPEHISAIVPKNLLSPDGNLMMSSTSKLFIHEKFVSHLRDHSERLPPSWANMSGQDIEVELKNIFLGLLDREMPVQVYPLVYFKDEGPLCSIEVRDGILFECEGKQFGIAFHYDPNTNEYFFLMVLTLDMFVIQALQYNAALPGAVYYRV